MKTKRILQLLIYRLSLVFAASCIILAVFLLYYFLILSLFPSWSERGMFGDAFGALSALVSTVALIGVVYALLIQQRQLHEMQRGVEFQQQPVIAIAASEFMIDRPDVFVQPDISIPQALSRFRCGLLLSNVSEMPAIELVASVTLVIPIEGGQEIIRSCGHHYPLVTSKEPVKYEAMLVPIKSETLLFEALRKKSAFALPYVSVELVYRNLLGACFSIRQAFHVLPSTDVDSDLKTWHAAIASFDATFQEELATNTRVDVRGVNLERIKKIFSRGIGAREFLALRLLAIQGAFDAEAISKDRYNSFINSVGFPRLVLENTICPISMLKKPKNRKSAKCYESA